MMSERYLVQYNSCNCHPETCCCDPYKVVDSATNNKTVATFYHRDRAVAMAATLNPVKTERECVLVWKTEKGDRIRLTHMSDEHIRNGIVWLLKDGDGFSDLTDLYEGIMIGAWIDAMSDELYNRLLAK